MMLIGVPKILVNDHPATRSAQIVHLIRTRNDMYIWFAGQFGTSSNFDTTADRAVTEDETASCKRAKIQREYCQ